MAQALEILETTEGTAHVLSLVGRVDTNTSSQLDVAVRQVFANDPTPDIIVDMQRCEFVSSAGLRVIVAAQKRARRSGSLVFRNVPESVMSVFTMTDFDKILTIV